MIRIGGHDLIVLVFTAILVWHAGRAAFPEGNPPAFVVEDSPGIFVWLGKGFGSQGIRQFDDGVSLGDVIELTDVLPPISFREGLSSQWPVLSGQSYHVEQGEEGSEIVQDGFFSAARQMALGIPLHPDRMKYHDWLELKGIGPVIAERIESFRQKNGDFGGLEHLRRVKGIGPKRIERWQKFF
ncbi:MAG TPA: helix-hairpin-helix domain-containing protein [Desulfuromonadales bacterium]|nr:helix-hairpin-helix domain-containing protein [Desulfuromonadales bacterium]